MSEFHFDTQTGDVLQRVKTCLRVFDISSLGPVKDAPRLRYEPDNPATPLLIDVVRDPEFPYAPGSFPKLEVDHWDRTEYVKYGKWVLRLFDSAPDDLKPHERTLTTPLVENLYTLGAGISIGRIDNRFGNFTTYKKEIGAIIQNDKISYRDWATPDYVGYAKKLITKLGRIPTFNDYRAASQATRGTRGPNPSRIQEYMGSLGALHELLGYPNVREWGREDYIDWGLLVMRANPDIEFTSRIPNILSRRKSGPTNRPIENRFGSWSNFKAALWAAHDEYVSVQKAKAVRYNAMIDRGELPEDWKKLTTDELIQYGARYRLAKFCLPEAGQERLWNLAAPRHNSFTYRLREASGVDAAVIETEALHLDVSDDIWPLTEYMERLRVTPEEIVVARQYVASSKKRERQRAATRAAQAHGSDHDPAQNSVPPHATPCA